MPSVEEMIRSSSCFGLAYDGNIKECQTCDVRLKCEAKCYASRAVKPAPVEIATPQEVTNQNVVVATKPAATVLVVPSEKKPKATSKTAAVKSPPKKKNSQETEKPKVNYAPDMPSFKDMDVTQLNELAKQRGIDTEPICEKYKVPNILRMRLTMAIKETYIVE